MSHTTDHKKEMFKKIGVAAGLVAIVGGVIGLVVLLQPDGASLEAIEQQETTQDPTIGPDTARVELREYSDFQCPSCQAAAPVVKKLLAEYGDQVQFVYNDYPLTTIHDYAQAAAVSAQCVFDQQKFFEYHDLLFERQRSWSQATFEDEARTAFRSYAQELGVNMEAYDTCIADPAIANRIAEDVAEGDALNVSGTPSFFVNGKRVDTSQGYEAGIRTAIDEALAQ